MKKLLLALALCAAPLTARAQLPFVLTTWVTPSVGQQLDEFWWSGLAAHDPYTFGLWTFDGTTLSITTPALWQQAGQLPIEGEDVQHVLTGGLSLAGDTRYAIGVVLPVGATYGGQGFQTAESCAPGDGAYVHTSEAASTYWQPLPCSVVPYFGFVEPNVPTPTVTPEPASMALLGTGLLALVAFGGRRKR